MKSKEMLHKFSHFRVGGNCKNLFLPKSESDVINIYRNFDNVIAVGGGSNILFGEVENTAVVSDKMLPQKIEINKNRVVVSSNININSFIVKMQKLGLGGLEFLAGIPAHIGGLTKMNAGAFGQQFSDFVSSIKFVDTKGNIRILDKSGLQFSYRNLDLPGFILEVGLELAKIPSEISKVKMHEYVQYRKKTQPLNKPNLGCFFKNINKESTGKLLDNLGLKGMQVGGAEVSNKHANFIINSHQATFDDVMILINRIKNEVKTRTGKILELEVKVING